MWMVLPFTDYFPAISKYFLTWIVHPCDLFRFLDPSGSSVMDSDRSSGSSATSPSAKIRNCQCGRRMSSLIRAFHSVCIDCRGIDCDIDTRCIECTDVNDTLMTVYVKYKSSLRCKPPQMLKPCRGWGAYGLAAGP